MYTIDETQDMLDAIAEDLPEEFFKDLNGGGEDKPLCS